MRIGNIGSISDCGPNQCGVMDAIGNMFGMGNPLFISNECKAYVACVATGGHFTPMPSQMPPDVTDIPSVIDGQLPEYYNTPEFSAVLNESFNSIPAQQARCITNKGDWDAASSLCHDSKSFASYIPWIVVGLGLVLVVPAILPRR